MTPDEMEDVATKVGVTDFDILLVGDGSGTVSDKPCGFTCFAYERKTKNVICLRGALSHGTNNLAELMPYVHAIWYYYKADSTTFNRKRFNISIISDSELTVKQGNREYARLNNPFWETVSWFEKNFCKLSWHHVRRNTNPVSTKCDEIAGQMRKSLL